MRQLLLAAVFQPASMAGANSETRDPPGGQRAGEPALT